MDEIRFFFFIDAFQHLTLGILHWIYC